MTAKKTPSKPVGPVDVIGLGIDKLLRLTEKNAKATSKMFRASTWKPRYIDFIDLRTGTPSLPWEYFFGSRGLICGRVFCVVANEAVGKSTLLTLFYGMGQRTGGVWADHVETEIAQTPPDFMASLGCDPNQVVISRPDDVAAGLNHINTFVATVRRELDKEKKFPIIIGIDSVSGLAGEDVNEDTGVVSGGAGLAPHSREVSEFFRNSLSFMESADALLLFTGQKKAKVEKTGFGPGGGGPKSTFIAEGTIKFHSSWIVSMYKQQLQEKGGDGKDANVGDRIFATTEKNKLAPKDRVIEIHLYRDGRGIDMTKANLNLLFSNTSPFPEEFGSSGNGFYWHKDVAGGKKLKGRDFVAEFYQNADLLRRCREKLRIRGFDFAFETDYPLIPQAAVELEAVANSDEPEHEEFPDGQDGPGEAAGPA